MRDRSEIVSIDLLSHKDNLKQISAEGIAEELLVEALKNLYDGFIDDLTISAIKVVLKQDRSNSERLIFDLTVVEAPHISGEFSNLSLQKIDLLKCNPVEFLTSLAFESPTERVYKNFAAELFEKMNQISHIPNVEGFNTVTFETISIFEFGPKTEIEKITTISLVIETKEKELNDSSLDQLTYPKESFETKAVMQISDIFSDYEPNAASIGRIKKALYSKDIFISSDLEKYKEREISNLKGMGEKTFNYLKQCMKRHGIKFKDSE